jgi:exosome complex component RRP41
MGGRKSDVILLNDKGIRSDGRKANEHRKITINVGILKKL